MSCRLYTILRVRYSKILITGYILNSVMTPFHKTDDDVFNGHQHRKSSRFLYLYFWKKYACYNCSVYYITFASS